MQRLSEDRAERSRRAIIEAARPIFAEGGYAGASLNRIIVASGLTKGGFYFHFPSKQALALAVIADANERWVEEARAEVAKERRAIDRVFAFPRILARTTGQGRGPYALRKLVDELSADPALRDEVCGSVRTGIETTAAQFREAQEEGSIRADLDPLAMAEIAVGAFVGMLTLTEQLGDDELERRVGSLIGFVRSATAVHEEGGANDG
jgi:AcrR family transcriptional regulator